MTSGANPCPVLHYQYLHFHRTFIENKRFAQSKGLVQNILLRNNRELTPLSVRGRWGHSPRLTNFSVLPFSRWPSRRQDFSLGALTGGGGGAWHGGRASGRRMVPNEHIPKQDPTWNTTHTRALPSLCAHCHAIHTLFQTPPLPKCSAAPSQARESTPVLSGPCTTSTAINWVVLVRCCSLFSVRIAAYTYLPPHASACVPKPLRIIL